MDDQVLMAESVAGGWELLDLQVRNSSGAFQRPTMSGIYPPDFQLGTVRQRRQQFRRFPTLDLGLGLSLPLEVRGVLHKPGWPFEAVVEFVNSFDGPRVTCVQTKAVDPSASATSAVLRAVPVDRLVSLVQAMAFDLVAVEDYPDVMRADFATLGSEERLEVVAATYRIALAYRHNATEHVAKTTGVSRATAGRLVRQCREAGLLTPARKGRS